MKPVTRLVRTAVLLTAPALLAARAVRSLVGVPGRAATAVRGSEPEPVAGPLFAAPEPAVAPVPTFSSAPAPEPVAASQPVAVEEVPVFASELPIASYDAMNVRDASTAIKKLTDPEQVRLILRYEEENAKRTTVHKAARLHLTSLEGASL